MFTKKRMFIFLMLLSCWLLFLLWNMFPIQDIYEKLFMMTIFSISFFFLSFWVVYGLDLINGKFKEKGN